MTCPSGRKNTLGPNDIQVRYRVTESLDPRTVDSAYAHLSEQELTCSARLQFPDDRRDYVVAHDLLRRSLSLYSPVAPNEWEFDSEANGKPLIRDSHFEDGTRAEFRLSFSLSHARGIVACAISRYALLGVDVERLDRMAEVEALAESYYSTDEIAALQSCPQDEQAARFFEQWTLKEAFLKATGAGLSEPLSSVCFEFVGDDSIIFSPTRSDAQLWHFGLFAPTSHSRLAVAVRRDGGESPRILTRPMEGNSLIGALRLSTDAA